MNVQIVLSERILFVLNYRIRHASPTFQSLVILVSQSVTVITECTINFDLPSDEDCHNRAQYTQVSDFNCDMYLKGICCQELA